MVAFLILFMLVSLLMCPPLFPFIAGWLWIVLLANKAAA